MEWFIAVALLGLHVAVDAQQIPFQVEDKRPNIVFILTDDQDVHLSSLHYMPFVRKHILDQGTYFNKHYCTTAVCCPSRATLWTGKAAHNTNITDVNPPYGTRVLPFSYPILTSTGGYPKFVAGGFNENYLPVWLQEAGYNTYYTGKLFNVHTVDNYNSPFAAGFTGNVRLSDCFGLFHPILTNFRSSCSILTHTTI
jgi:arylsulfatase A-like enzyme